MSTSQGFIERHGRKFVLSLFAMMLGTVVTLFGISACVKAPEAAPNIAGILTAFAGILAVGIGAYNSANAFIQGKAIENAAEPEAK